MALLHSSKSSPSCQTRRHSGRRLGVGAVWFAGLSLAVACVSHRVYEISNGKLRIQCPSVLAECMEEAEAHCLSRGGIQVVSTREKNELYGVEGNKEGTLVSEVIFYCGDDAPRPPIKLPPRPVASVEDTSGESAQSERRICIAGSTQRCIGPGACVGGQTCNDGGTAWGPCLCAAPSAQPSSSAPETIGSTVPTGAASTNAAPLSSSSVGEPNPATSSSPTMGPAAAPAGQ